jgi:serine/threonine-protein kinase
MSIDCIKTLLTVIRRTELLSDEQVEEVARELGPLYTNPQDLARYLVEVEWLTPYQCETIFEGNLDELVVGPYQLLARLGQGGVSEVYKAWDTLKGRVVALKVLRETIQSLSDAVRQFERELQAVTRLCHPNIIKTYDADQIGHVHYFAMEYVEGTDLQRYVTEQGPLPVDQACDYIRQVAQGLQYAHGQALVHRDIKPANLFLINPPALARQPQAGPAASLRRGPDPFVKILDWGLARIKPAPGEAPEPSNNLETEEGQLIGTADYIAPEQARDPSLVDTRADIYSLGCTFFFLLTGKPPYPGNSLMQKVLMHQEAPPPSVREIRPEVPEEVDGIVRKMLAKNVDERFQIPLLVVAPLRYFCPGAVLVNGSVIRPPSSPNLGSVYRPASSGNLGTSRPASSPNLNGVNRPASSSNLGPFRPGSNGR